MADKLWTDKDVREAFKTYGRNNAKKMRDDYERALAFRNEDIGRLQGELKQATARIAELESQLQQAQVSEADYMILRSANADLKEQLQTAQQWQPVSDEALCFDTADGITASASGKWLRCEDFADKTHVDILLPDNIRLCRKIQPAA